MDDSRTDPRPDAQLARDLCAGDATAFDAFYWRYRDWVVALAYRFTHDHDDSLDVLQETFAYLVRKADGFVLTASMKTFLYPVVRNLSLEIRRKRHRTPHDAEHALDLLPAPVERGDDRADLAAVVSDLPQPQREVLLMRFVDGLKLEEIATALGVPLGTVKSRLHHALESLRSSPAIRHHFAPRK